MITDGEVAEIAEKGWYATRVEEEGENVVLKELAVEVKRLRVLVMGLGDRCLGLVEIMQSNAMKGERVSGTTNAEVA